MVRRVYSGCVSLRAQQLPDGRIEGCGWVPQDGDWAGLRLVHEFGRWGVEG